MKKFYVLALVFVVMLSLANVASAHGGGGRHGGSHRHGRHHGNSGSGAWGYHYFEDTNHDYVCDACNATYHSYYLNHRHYFYDGDGDGLCDHGGGDFHYYGACTP